MRAVHGFALVPRDGPIWRWAPGVLIQTDLLFPFWHEFRAGQLDRAQCQTLMAVVEEAGTRLLREGTRLPPTKPAGWCNDLLLRGPALWSFVREEGVAPTGRLLGQGGGAGAATSGAVAHALFWHAEQRRLTLCRADAHGHCHLSSAAAPPARLSHGGRYRADGG